MNYGNGSDQTKQANYGPPMTAGGSAPPQPGNNVHTILSEQEKRIEQLHNTITDLEQRLSCVLAPDQPSPAGSVAEAVRDSGMVLDRIGRAALAIEYATSRLGRLLGRLQL